jgi:hypothetical protein
VSILFSPQVLPQAVRAACSLDFEPYGLDDPPKPHRRDAWPPLSGIEFKHLFTPTRDTGWERFPANPQLATMWRVRTMDGLDPQASTAQESADTIFARLDGNDTVSAPDVLALRRAIYGNGSLDAGHVDAVFRLDQRLREKCDAWREFYVDSLTDFFIWRSDPPNYISEDQGEFLIRNLLRDNKIAGITEFELLVNLTHWAVSTPDQLKTLVLEAVRDSVLSPDEALYATGRKAGVITAVDVAMIRRTIYGRGGFGDYTVSLPEAELIFELEDATASAANADGWQDLFVKAIANYLMFPRGVPVVPTAVEYKRREEWLKEQRGVGNMLKEISKNAASLDKLKDGWQAMDTFGGKERRAEAKREEERMREAVCRESIDAREAQWLTDRISANETVTENERTLLRFIRENAPQIDPHLARLMDTLGI